MRDNYPPVSDKAEFRKRAVLLVCQPFTFFLTDDRNNIKFPAVLKAAKRCKSLKIPVIAVTYKSTKGKLKDRGVYEHYKNGEPLNNLADYRIELITKERGHAIIIDEIKTYYKKEFIGEYKQEGSGSGDTKMFRAVATALLEILMQIRQSEKDFLDDPPGPYDLVSRDIMLVVGGYVQHCLRNYLKFLQDKIKKVQEDGCYIKGKIPIPGKIKPLNYVLLPRLWNSNNIPLNNQLGIERKLAFFRYGWVGKYKIEENLYDVIDYEKFFNEFIH